MQEIPNADKITLVVSLKHEPGSLYNMLGNFYHNGLNMLNIESRPIEVRRGNISSILMSAVICMMQMLRML